MTRANPKKSVAPKINVMRNIETAKTELKLKRLLQTWTDPTTGKMLRYTAIFRLANTSLHQVYYTEYILL